MHSSVSVNPIDRSEQDHIPSLFAHDVVISFANDDQAYALETADVLAEYGVRVLTDAFQTNNVDYISSKRYDNMTGAYLRQARLYSVLISRAYLQQPNQFIQKYARRYVEKIADPAKFDDIYIVPVHLDKTPVPAELRTPFVLAAMSEEDLAYEIASKFHQSR